MHVNCNDLSLVITAYWFSFFDVKFLPSKFIVLDPIIVLLKKNNISSNILMKYIGSILFLGLNSWVSSKFIVDF